ncbi:response regulator transcription factor [Pseudobutyrivibrio sp.]
MKILVVDDEKEILTLIKKALNGQYQVDTVHFPKENIPEDLSGYSLILMDVMMPNENGYTIVEKIRKQVDCPIIFLSAKALEDDIVYGLAIGADDYICKPFSVAELRARVSAHIRRENRGSACNFIRRGDVSVNLTEKRISVREKEIKLTKSEYEIVKLLIKNIGQIYSKSQLYEYLYGYEKDGNDSAITEHIKNIRRKFQNEGQDPIDTVWGIGYRWKKEVTD